MGPAMRGWFQISQLARIVIAKAYLGYRPSKSIQGMVENAHALTVRSGVGKIPRGWLGKLNRTLRGWSNYFAVGTVTKPYWAIDNYTAVRLRRWLRFKHKIRRRKGGPIHSRAFAGISGSLRLCRLGHDVRGRRCEVLSQPDLGDPPVLVR